MIDTVPVVGTEGKDDASLQKCHFDLTSPSCPGVRDRGLGVRAHPGPSQPRPYCRRTCESQLPHLPREDDWLCHHGVHATYKAPGSWEPLEDGGWYFLIQGMYVGQQDPTNLSS